MSCFRLIEVEIVNGFFTDTVYIQPMRYGFGTIGTGEQVCKTLRATRRRDGFTLLELSLVLVIVGLLIGGIVVGRELIRQGELRQVLSDMTRYSTAVNTFREKYKYLPGDIPNATDFWGPIGGSPPYTSIGTTCLSTVNSQPVGDKKTCNGNGNGMISGGGTVNNDGIHPCDGSPYWMALVCDYEQYAVWQHLANAGLDNGVYVPTFFNPVWKRGIGGNMPSSKFNPNEGFMLSYVCGDIGKIVWETACGHYFYYGSQNPVPANGAQDIPLWPAFTIVEALGIDTKIDDGKPGTGKVLSTRNTGHQSLPSPNCATQTTSSNSVYDTNNAALTGKQCGLMFKADF